MKPNLDNLQSALSRYLLLADEDPKQVKVLHDIRVYARKLIVVMDPDDPQTTTLKKLIQFSNKIRDIDVFTNEILPLFPKSLRANLAKAQQVLHINRMDMNLEFKSLLSTEWLEDLTPEPTADEHAVKTTTDRHKMALSDIEKRLKKALRDLNRIDLEDKHYHKIRLLIKRLHYQLLRFYPQEKPSIALAKQLQQKLGEFHDLYQAINLLKQHKSLIKPKTYKQCKLFLKERKQHTIKTLRKIATLR